MLLVRLIYSILVLRKTALFFFKIPTIKRFYGCAIGSTVFPGSVRLGGGMFLNKKPVSLTPVLAHVVDELKIIWANREIITEFDIDEPVECDPNRIAQLFSNLLANAITHGAQEKPVYVKAFSKDGIFELSVGNSGNPIPEDHIKKIFEPFTRENVRPSLQGLGLGLYIASEISRAHGGEFNATSNEVETRFTFRLRNNKPAS